MFSTNCEHLLQKVFSTLMPIYALNRTLVMETWYVSVPWWDEEVPTLLSLLGRPNECPVTDIHHLPVNLRGRMPLSLGRCSYQNQITFHGLCTCIRRPWAHKIRNWNGFTQVLLFCCLVCGLLENKTSESLVMPLLCSPVLFKAFVKKSRETFCTGYLCTGSGKETRYF
jgi:hypothetical protein